MQIAHKIELKPNNKQMSYFKKACGVSRFVWNWGLAEWNRQYKENKILDIDKKHKISGMGLKKQFNAIKKEQFPWTKEVTKYAAQQPFIHLQLAWNRYFKKVKNVGRPEFKKKSKVVDSFYIGGDQVKVKDKKVWIPNLGLVRMKEDLRFTGKINSATISRISDRWFASIQVDTKALEDKQHLKENFVGIDLGINAMATLSNGMQLHSTKPLKKYLRKLKREQRVISKKIRTAKKKGNKLFDSKNFQKQKRKVATTHFKIAKIRKDTLHKTTSYITNHFKNIVIEDLNVKGMLKNHKLARHISDIGFGEFRRQLEYKSEVKGNVITVANRFFPSSKTCSSCGKKKDNLSLKDRVFRCECGLTMDRDLNASINLENIINFKIRPARPEFTPVEMTAMQKSVFPVRVTSIYESGSKLQTG